MPPRRPAPATAAAASNVVGPRRSVLPLEPCPQVVRLDCGSRAPERRAINRLRTGPSTINPLAHSLLVHQRSISRLLHRLGQRRLVRRSRSKTDRRFGRIASTGRDAMLATDAPEQAHGRLRHGLSAMPGRRLREIRRAIHPLIGAMEAKDVKARFCLPDA